MAITKESIINASLDILNRDGIDNLSMRTLARELNIKAASLYWHIKDKQALYDLLAEHISQDVHIPETMGNPKEALINHALDIRKTLLNTRNAVEVLSESFPASPNRLKAIRYLLSVLLEYGVSSKNCLAAANIVNNYIMSFVADEIRAKSIPPEAAGQFAIIFGAQFEINLDFEQQFLYGLRVLTAGLLVE